MRASKTALKARIGRYLRKWTRLLGVDREWDIDIRVQDKLRIEDAHAETEWAAGYRNAEIRFASCLGVSHTLRQLEHAVLHETLHLVFADLHDTIYRQIGDADNLMARSLFMEEEKVIDRLANIITLLERGE